MPRWLATAGLALGLGIDLPAYAQVTPFVPDIRFATAFHASGFHGASNPMPTIATLYQGQLVIAGAFTQFNANPTGNVARWNGSDWTGLGYAYKSRPICLSEAQGKLFLGGTEMPGTAGAGIYGFAIHDGTSWTTHTLPSQGQLWAAREWNGTTYLGGIKLLPGSRAIATWNGSSIQTPPATLPGTVAAFAEYGGELIAVGNFPEEAGNGARSVARFNGTSWSGLGTGVLKSGGSGAALAALIFEGDLVIAGNFDDAGGTLVHDIARWNGTSWSDLGPTAASVDAYVDDIEIFQGELYASLKFTGATQDPNVLRWDGTNWAPVGTGHPFGTFKVIDDLQSHGGRLFALGTGGVASWDGSSWTLAGTPRFGGMNDWVQDIAIYNDNLVAAGRFTQAGEVAVNHIARWDGSTWHPLGDGLPTTPGCLSVHNGKLYAGGSFSQFTTRIREWDGVQWQTLDTLPNSGTVNAMISYNGDLILGGRFTSIGGVSANYIARWDGTQFYPLGTGIDGCNGNVQSLEVLNGSLYVGGEFDGAGGVTAHRIARWDGANWFSVGSAGGVTDPCSIQWLSDVSSATAVRTLEAWSGVIAMGGHFGQVNNVSRPLVARTGAGTPPSISGPLQFSSWTSEVLGLANNNGTLYAVGNLSSSPSIGSSFARWTGTTWEGIGAIAAVGFNIAERVVSDGNFLYLSGSFFEAGSVSSVHIARYSTVPTSGVSDPSEGRTPGLVLGPGRPTPFRGSVHLSFTLAERGPVGVDVFDVSGRRLKSIATGVFEAGTHEVTWDGRDETGRDAVSGIYFLKVLARGESQSQRVVKVH